MELERALADTFGLPGFRPGQREVIASVLSGTPTVAVMPTGAGKSLCYQLPAVVAGGTTLVVSPLIALMKDQVDALSERGIAACAITSAISGSELSARLDDVAAGRMRLVYVAPERFKSGRFESALARVQDKLELLAIDEAHCISEWGHDFRPDYMRLGDVVRRWRPKRLVALTATATPDVRKDIARQLGMESPAVFVRGFDRPNLRFAVEKVGGVKDKASRLKVLLKKKTSGSALVYAATRKNAEALAEALQDGKVKALAYHAGLDDDKRTRVQDAFMNDEVDVVVATNAFGMGVDKSDVRLVVHADLPRSPEAYYQEAGRGGRDGLRADCILLFNHADVRLQEFLIDASVPSVDLLRAIWRVLRQDPRAGGSTGQLRRQLPGDPNDAAVGAATRLLMKAGHLRERDGVLEALHPADDPSLPKPAPLDPKALEARAESERQKLRAMIDYAYATGCRRRMLLAYFGDEDARTLIRCGQCDVCESTSAEITDEDDLRRVRLTLSLLVRLAGRFGRTKVAAILVGDEEDDRFADLPERGTLARQGTRYVFDLLRALEGAGLVAVSPGEYPTLSVTRDGRKVVDGQAAPRMLLPSFAVAKTRGAPRTKREAPPSRPTGPVDESILERLRVMRRQLAAKEAMPPYVILHDSTMEEIARARPTDLAALGTLRGIGPAKLDKYGRSILAAISGV
jgi:ATP-dependent DNA helicase RecQ